MFQFHLRTFLLLMGLVASLASLVMALRSSSGYEDFRVVAVTRTSRGVTILGAFFNTYLVENRVMGYGGDWYLLMADEKTGAVSRRMIRGVQLQLNLPREDAIAVMVPSPSGKELHIGGVNRMWYTIDVEQDSPIRTHPGPTNGVQLALSPDGRYLAVSGEWLDLFDLQRFDDGEAGRYRFLDLKREAHHSAPRWRNGELWVSDSQLHHRITIDALGRPQITAKASPGADRGTDEQGNWVPLPANLELGPEIAQSSDDKYIAVVFPDKATAVGPAAVHVEIPTQSDPVEFLWSDTRPNQFLGVTKGNRIIEWNVATNQVKEVADLSSVATEGARRRLQLIVSAVASIAFLIAMILSWWWGLPAKDGPAKNDVQRLE